MDKEFGVSRWKLLHLEWISNDVLLCRIGNNRSLGIEHDGIWGKKCVYIYIIYICICMYNCIPLLYNGNWHIINQSYFNKKKISSPRGSLGNYEKQYICTHTLICLVLFWSHTKSKTVYSFYYLNILLQWLFYYRWEWPQFFFFFFGLFRATPEAYGSSQATEVQVPAYATATPDPSRVCDLHHSSTQQSIL